MVWNKKGVPHKGWSDTGATDLGEEKGRDVGEFATCEMCGRPRLRYVHFMAHPDHDAVLSVGRVCAAKMTALYVTTIDKRTSTPRGSCELPTSVSG